MIKHLSIKNYALIESLELDFDEGVSIITGETGAGKSILLGALSLVLGHRADTNVLFNTSAKCIVEAYFDISNHSMLAFFEENELDFETVTIVRREITPNNRSRAFINDTPVSNAILKTFTSSLLDIHSQHDTLSLLQSGFQLAILDDFSDNFTLLENYKKTFYLHQNIKKQLEELLATEQKSKNDIDYYSFLFHELETAQLKTGEQEEAEKELAMINHAEDIKKSLDKIAHLLYESDENILSGLTDVNLTFNTLLQYMPDLNDLYQRAHSVYIELKDINDEVLRLKDNITYSDERAQEINDRLNTLYELEKKHKVDTVEALLEVQETLSEKLSYIDSLEDEIKAKELQLKDIESTLKLLAEDLSNRRKKNINIFNQEITSLLKALGMPDARFDIKIKSGLLFKEDGTDSITFLFSANKGIAPDDIARIASGGELSRLMLSVKSVISEKKLLPSLIFDEIDTGISGETAVKTAGILKNMGKNMQIIAITHLPQIASLGKNHFVVTKASDDKITRTQVMKPNKEERIKVIAEMIGGHHYSDAVLSTAKELLKKFES